MMRKATFNTAKFAYWDIESLSNVFTLAVYTQWDHGLHVFYLVDSGSVNGYSPGLLADPGTKARVLERVRAANPAWVSARERAGLDPAGGLHLYDLSTFDANHRLARIMGLSDASSVNDPRSASSYPGWYRPVCDTDTELYDPTSELTPFLAGYNSRNYDTVMLSLYLCEVMGYTIDVMGRCQDKALRRAGLPPHAQPGPDLSAAVEREVLDLLPKEFTPTSASLMRSHSDALFSEEYKAFMPSYLTQGPPAGGHHRCTWFVSRCSVPAATSTSPSSTRPSTASVSSGCWGCWGSRSWSRTVSPAPAGSTTSTHWWTWSLTTSPTS